MENNDKPLAFIASSVEALPIAKAIQNHLHHICLCPKWSENTFSLSEYPLESLEAKLDQADFGIFVFHPDDKIIYRKEEKASVRDNVLIELGMFVGRLGRKRTFMVVPSNKDIQIPSDLNGLTPAKYELQENSEINDTLLAPACNQIEAIILKLGVRNKENISETKNQSIVKNGSQTKKK